MLDEELLPEKDKSAMLPALQRRLWALFALTALVAVTVSYIYRSDLVIPLYISPFMLFVVGPLLGGYLLGWLLAFLPFRGLAYGKKYQPASLLLALLINGTLMLMMAWILLVENA